MDTDDGHPLRDGLSQAEPVVSALRASIPDAVKLQAGWPIPLNPAAEGVFCDLAEEGAQTGLLALMTGISEEYWCAGWMSGLEYSLWHAREHGPMAYGQGWITERQCQLLRLLSEEADGWWHWTNVGARFARLDNWIAHTKAQGMETREGGNEVPSQSDDSPVGNADAPEGSPVTPTRRAG